MTTSAPGPAATPQPIRRDDYRSPDFTVPTVSLVFVLGAEQTYVRATLAVVRHGDHDRPLRLHGDGLVPVAVRVDGHQIDTWRMDGDDLVISLAAATATIETEVALAPAANSQLMGLYASGGLLCTQCESEGFRRITFFPDRPDVLSRYEVRLEADKATYPVLLCNGDLIASGDLPEGRHFAVWNDPFPKPSYLFALVAGNLKANRDTFTTMSGKTVELGIWVAEADLPKTAHAMHALKLSMAWDEQVYGREYDLGIFNIVAVSDFNFGAMENKGLNIFNSNYVLADAATATDVDYDNVLGVVAHEYFHNWSGNRVTCRDWFQLSLKEGFTVFRDQCFSADQGSAAVQRIGDVRGLRAAQFQEDAGPLAHPIRPESYLEISNFYTATVYEKGAEVIRMLHTLLGAKAFRAGSDLYFARHDGSAATCEDFVRAMEEASGRDLTQFRRWYSYAGTPRVAVALAHDAARKTATLTLTQTTPDTPGQTDKAPMAIPFRLALFDRATGKKMSERLEVLTDRVTTVSVGDCAAPPVASLLRDFSAPIIVETKRTLEELAFLSAHDDDPFGRFEALQQLMLQTMLATIAGEAPSYEYVIKAVRTTCEHPALDPALIAEAIILPSEAFIGDQMTEVKPEAIASARDALRRELGRALDAQWRAIYAAHAQPAYAYTPAAKGARRLRNAALGYLMSQGSPETAALCHAQFETSDNMTDQMAALVALTNSDAAQREPALAAFYARYRDNALVVNKWFAVQAGAARPDTCEVVKGLSEHADFSLTNPNRVRSLLGNFAANQRHFHRQDGAGYVFLADFIMAVDPINPQVAARQVPALGQWRRFDASRQGMMRTALQRLVAMPNVSKDVFEQASKCLA